MAMLPEHHVWYNLGKGNSPHGYYATPNTLLFPSDSYSGHRSVDSMRVAALGDVNKKMITKDGFQVCLDVHQFAPKEINVKTVDNCIVVEAKHEERPDEHGHISRHFIRRYGLPTGFNIKDVVPSLSSDGILTIKAPHEGQASEGSNVRVLQIQQTGPAALNIHHDKEHPENGHKMSVDKKM